MFYRWHIHQITERNWVWFRLADHGEFRWFEWVGRLFVIREPASLNAAESIAMSFRTVTTDLIDLVRASRLSKLLHVAFQSVGGSRSIARGEVQYRFRRVLLGWDGRWLEVRSAGWGLPREWCKAFDELCLKVNQ